MVMLTCLGHIGLISKTVSSCAIMDEEMYGMIWYLAYQLVAAEAYIDPAHAVKEARDFYKEGLTSSPTKRYK